MDGPPGSRLDSGALGAGPLQASVLAWYGQRARALPFRATADPYAILVSEVMAQQTQAARAGEAWTRFMVRFPTVDVLADASTADVIRAWRGLGYNRRALNLRNAARLIVDRFAGSVPRSLADLESLPGVGPYTARAVAALAFGLAVGPVDTNVRRVLGRVVAGEDRVLSGAELQDVADAMVPAGRSAAWTHALMDLGATLCRPSRPDCEGCPARWWCRFAAARRLDPAAAAPTRATSGPAVSERPAPFHTTSRWLRGRILDRLREAPDGAWMVLEGAIGGHDPAAVKVALQALERDGLLELRPTTSRGFAARLAVA